MRGPHPQGHVTLQYHSHVTNKIVISPLSQGLWPPHPPQKKNLVGRWLRMRKLNPKSHINCVVKWKIYRKYLCKSFCVCVSFLLKLTQLSLFTFAFLQATTGRNFTIKGLQHGLFPANFEKFLRSVSEYRKMLLFLLDLDEILPLLSKQLQYFSYYIATVVLAQPYKRNNRLTF